MEQKKRQTYNDGVCDVYAVVNVSAPGKKPETNISFRCRLRYAERTVGMTRYYTALQSDTRVDRLLRIPRREEISRDDVVMLDNKQYGIRQIKYPADATPPSMDITLTRIEAKSDVINAGPV